MLRMLYGGLPGGLSVVMAVTGPTAAELKEVARARMKSVVEKNFLNIIVLLKN